MAWFICSSACLFVAGRHLRGRPAASVQRGCGSSNAVVRRGRSALLIIWRRDAPARRPRSPICSARCIGGAIGLGLAKTIGAALFWADAERSRGSCSCTASSCCVFPYLGHRDGGAQGRVARAGAAGRALPRRRAAEALSHPRHQRHHRRPHRRHLRDRLPRRHARHPAVRAQGAAARRRLGRFDEAQPRPARPRHPAEDPEDVGPRRHDLGHRLSRSPRSRSEAHRAGAHAPGQDRHQRLQPEQGRAAARRRRS